MEDAMIPVLISYEEVLRIAEADMGMYGWDGQISADEAVYLNDVTTCLVTEERNGKYDLKMTYKIGGDNSSAIQNNTIVLVKPNEKDRIQPFRIYRITKEHKGTATAYGEHISGMLADIPVENDIHLIDSTAEYALNKLKTKAMIDCPFTFSSDVTTVANFACNELIPTSIKTMMQGITGSILQTYNGEWRYDWFNVSLLAARGNEDSDGRVTILYGKNITGVKQDSNIADVYSGICPYWAGRDETDTETVVTIQNNIVYAENHDSFPCEKILPVDFSRTIEKCPTQAQLLSAAESYITNNKVGVPDISIQVNFIPTWQAMGIREIESLERVALCDVVNVIYPPLNVVAEAKVVKTVYNVLKDRYDSIEIGTIKQNLPTTVGNGIESLSRRIEGFIRSQSKSSRIILGAGETYIFNTKRYSTYQVLVISGNESINGMYYTRDLYVATIKASENVTITKSATAITITSNYSSSLGVIISQYNKQ